MNAPYAVSPRTIMARMACAMRSARTTILASKAAIAALVRCGTWFRSEPGEMSGDFTFLFASRGLRGHVTGQIKYGAWQSPEAHLAMIKWRLQTSVRRATSACQGLTLECLQWLPRAQRRLRSRQNPSREICLSYSTREVRRVSLSCVGALL